MRQIIQEHFKGERSLFGQKELIIKDSVFSDGESPLKESKDLQLDGCLFQWKYPLWYCKNVVMSNCALFEMARAGIWYTDCIEVNDTMIQAPKNFRRCDGISLVNVAFTRAEETLWNCKHIKMKNVTAKGSYFAMNSTDIDADGLFLDGNYSFDGSKNVTVKNSRMLSKDAFWNSENITVSNSFISGEYLGWNSKNLTFINCTIESLQGMCYIENLKMINCKLINTTLSFEYSTVEADISSGIDSVFNPGSGTIKADKIKELIIEKDKVDPEKTKIICKSVDKRSDRPEWLE